MTTRDQYLERMSEMLDEIESLKTSARADRRESEKLKCEADRLYEKHLETYKRIRRKNAELDQLIDVMRGRKRDEEPPMEDVLRNKGVVAIALDVGRGSDEYRAIAYRHPESWEGTGFTVDAAIRAAVANAKEQG